jgi:L-lactate dehydrogenase (cytochrome)
MQDLKPTKPTWKYNMNYPGMDDLIRKAKSRIPRFAFEYLDGGCNEDVDRKSVV